jgi:uncharacterized protein
MSSAESGHDYNHILRVYRLSKRILKEELHIHPSLDSQVIKVAALLHDVDDWKFTDQHTLNRVQSFMDTLNNNIFTEE